MPAELSDKVAAGQVWHPWWLWEDHDAGLYSTPRGLADEAAAAAEVLADPVWAELAMGAVVAAWPVAAEHQLSNRRQNRRAWVGQAACRFAVDSTAAATRAAWPNLTDNQREAANAAAERVIRGWEDTRHG